MVQNCCVALRKRSKVDVTVSREVVLSFLFICLFFWRVVGGF